MSGLWVIVAVFAQAGLGMFLFMMAAFAGGGYANSANANRGFLIKLYNLCLLGLPALCAVASIMLIFAYVKGWSSTHYWWAALPLPFALLFVIFVFTSWQ